MRRMKVMLCFQKLAHLCVPSSVICQYLVFTVCFIKDEIKNPVLIIFFSKDILIRRISLYLGSLSTQSQIKSESTLIKIQL